MVNSRNKGNSYERKIMNELKEFFPNCMTSRNESKARDDAGVDLCHTGCFNFQLKAYKTFSGAKVLETLGNMPEEDNFNLVQVKIDRKGEFVAMSKNDFYEVLRILKANGIL